LKKTIGNWLWIC